MTKREKFLLVLLIITAILRVPLTEAYVRYAPSATISAGDITSTHILNNTITGDDISRSASTTMNEIGASTLWASSTVWSNRIASGNVGVIAEGSALIASDYLIIGSPTSGSGQRSAIRWTGSGYNSTPATAGNSSNGDKLVFYNDTSGKSAIGEGTTYDIWFQSNGTSSAGFKFWTGISTSALERMRITASGNVGIGTTSPYTLLSVGGEVVASHFTATTTATSTFSVIELTKTGTGIKYSDGSIQTVALTGYEIKQSSQSCSSLTDCNATVSCTAGNEVTGGGYVGSTTNAFSIYASYPSGTSGWTAYVRNTSGGSVNWSVFAICMNLN